MDKINQQSIEKQDNYIDKFFKSPFIKHIQVYYKLYSTITLVLLFIPSIMYLLTYSFLYGFYFSGNDYNNLNTFNIIKYFVPFNFNTLSYTGLLFSVVIGTFLIISKMIFSKKIFSIIFGAFFALIVHVLLAIFFINDPQKEEIINFIKIWAIPYFYVCIVYVSIKVIENPLKSFFSIGLSFIIAILILILLPAFEWDSGIKGTLLIMTIITLLVFIINKFKINIYLIALYLFPYIYLVTLVIFLITNKYLLKFNWEWSIILLIVIPAALFDFFIFNYIKKKNLMHHFENKPLFTEDNFNLKDFFLAPHYFINKDKVKVKDKAKDINRNKYILIYLQSLLLLVIIFFIYATTPKLAISTGYLIRNYSNEDSKIDMIEYSLNNELRTLEGKVIVEDGNKLYISDENYNLAIINSQFYKASKIIKVETSDTPVLLESLIDK